MKPFYLCAALVGPPVTSCKKDDAPKSLELPNNVTVSFMHAKLGATEMYGAPIEGAPVVTVSGGRPGLTYTYKVTGREGLKRSIDTLEHGEYTLDAAGNSKLVIRGLQNYEDGELTLEVKFKNPTVTLTAKTNKAESEIRNYRDFIKLASLSKSDSGHYVQVQDFAFPDTVFDRAVFIPRFFGSYDGQGHKIMNLSIHTVGINDINGDWAVGLFNFVGKGSVLKNTRLELSDAGYTTNGTAVVGGLVSMTNGGDITNCSVTGDITSSKTTHYSNVGGIVSRADSPRIVGCTYRGKITADYVGGITNYINESSIDYCYSHFSYDASMASGFAWNSLGATSVSNSYAVVTESISVSPYVAVGSSAGPQNLYNNCFANAGSTVEGVSILPTTEINTTLAAMEVTTANWPAWVTMPTNKKPYKYDTNRAAPLKLWWE